MKSVATIDGLRTALATRDTASIGSAFAADLKESTDRQSIRVPENEALADWLMVVWNGLHPDTGAQIDCDLWFDLVVAAADAVDDDALIWCVGAGPADHLVGEHPSMAGRLHAARVDHPRVEAMFRAMIADYHSMGYESAGWWSDPTSASS